MKNVYVADFSLALINRTGAYYVCRDVVERLSEFFVATRYWRFFLAREPQGLARRLFGRAMLLELRHLAVAQALAPLRRAILGRSTVFFDPLYVLGAELGPADIVLCHDVGPITHPQLFDHKTSELYELAYRRIMDARPGMVFVSHASRRAFVTCFGNAYRFLEVIPLYVRGSAGQGQAIAPAGVAQPFLLSVGALEERKNYHRTIEAFQASGLQARGYSYVICGPRGNNAKRIEALAASAAGVQLLGYLPDAELRWLYRNAVGFVLPSLLEGFGLPALEAGGHGLVSLVSAESAQTEAVGEGAIAVDPLSVQSIAEGMHRLVDMPAEERAERIALVQNQVTALSFERYLTRWAELLASSAERHT